MIKNKTVQIEDTWRITHFPVFFLFLLKQFFSPDVYLLVKFAPGSAKN